MDLVKKLFNWAEKRAIDCAYGRNLDREPTEPFSEVILDLFAMGITAPKLIYRKYSD